MNSPTKTSEQVILYKGLIFIASGAIILATATLLCWTLLPEEPLPRFDLSMLQSLADQEKQNRRSSKKASGESWWDRLTSGIRAKAEGKHITKRNPKNGKQLAVNHRSGVASTVTSEEQMILRQMIIAEEQLASTEGRPPESVAKRLSSRYSSYPWAPYELRRMTARILGLNYERTRNRDVLAQYAKVASAVADSDYSNFEDYFHAGHANLFAGNITLARDYLVTAEKTWPVKKGMTLGLNSLMILMCDAIGNRQTEFFDRLETIQESFPDWMFTEFYLPDLVILETAHPRAPLLHVLHGRLLAMTNNDAAALSHFRRAKGLTGESRGVVDQWINGLEARSK